MLPMKKFSFTGKAMQKTEIPVIPMDNASGRFESNHPDITASFELGWIRFLWPFMIHGD